MPRRVRAEDKWLEAEVSRGAAEDDPVLGTPEFQGEEQHLDEGCPQKAPPEGSASKMGPTWGYGAQLDQSKYIISALNAPTRVLTTLMRKDAWTG